MKKRQRQVAIQKGEVIKRKRRTAQGIVRKYQCPVEGCRKSYGSDGSLNQHIVNKHPREFEEFRAQKFQSVIVHSGNIHSSQHQAMFDDFKRFKYDNQGGGGAAHSSNSFSDDCIS